MTGYAKRPSHPPSSRLVVQVQADSGRNVTERCVPATILGRSLESTSLQLPPRAPAGGQASDHPVRPPSLLRVPSGGGRRPPTVAPQREQGTHPSQPKVPNMPMALERPAPAKGHSAHSPPEASVPCSLDIWLLLPGRDRSPAQDPPCPGPPPHLPGAGWGLQGDRAGLQGRECACWVTGGCSLGPGTWSDSWDGSYCRAVPHAKPGWMPPTSDLGRQIWFREGRSPQWPRGSSRPMGGPLGQRIPGGAMGPNPQAGRSQASVSPPAATISARPTPQGEVCRWGARGAPRALRCYARSAWTVSLNCSRPGPLPVQASRGSWYILSPPHPESPRVQSGC